MSFNIFLSYSRSDQRSARLLWEILRSRLHCEIFMDVVNNSIRLGTVFPDAVEQAITSSSVFILLMGKAWSSNGVLSGGRPIDDPNNWLRKEVALALEKRIRIIPVLLDGVSMPARGGLPEEISLLSHHHGIAIRDAEFDHDIEPLLETLEELVGSETFTKPDLRLLAADFIYYPHRFAKLIMMPKRVVRAFSATQSGELTRSLMFLTISLIIYSLFTAPLYVDQPRMGILLVVQFCMLFLMAFYSSAILQLSWRFMGGRAPFSRYLSITSYYFGVNFVLGVCLVAAALGVITLFDPPLLRLLKLAAEGDVQRLIVFQPLHSGAFRAALWTLGAGNLLLLIWTYSFWGSYREINGASRFSSFAAFLIANVISLPIGVIFVLIQAFLFNRLQGR
jgi:hypothetical protein